jgi:hypothetical protein
MASNSLALRFKMLGDVSGLTRATGKAGKDLSKLGKTTNGISRGMKSALAGIGLGLSLGGVVSYLKQAAEGAELARQADARVLQVAKSMKLFGGATESVTMRLSKYADTMELTTGQTAEVTKQVQSTLLTFASVGKTADKVGGIFDRATIAAADLAATGFGTAESNAVQLGKALSDPIKGLTALGKAGVTFTEKEKARIKTLVKSNQLTKAQNIVLKAIEKQVGGVAEKTALSSVKLSNAFGQVSDEVGNALLPYLDKLAKFVTSKKGQAEIKKLAETLVGLVKEAGKFAKWALENKEAVLGIVGAIAALKIGSSIITGYKTLLGVWKGLVKFGKLIRPPAVGTDFIGPQLPGKKKPKVDPTLLGGKTSKIPKLLKAGGVLGVAALVLSVPSSSKQDTPEEAKKRAADRDAYLKTTTAPTAGQGNYLRPLGFTGTKPAAQMVPGGLGIVAPKPTNITINVTNANASGEDIVNALKRYAARLGRSGNVYNLGSL